jgi:hypothetical protein
MLSASLEVIDGADEHRSDAATPQSRIGRIGLGWVNFQVMRRLGLSHSTGFFY